MQKQGKPTQKAERAKKMGWKVRPLCSISERWDYSSRALRRQ
jgi:predicted GNAT family acetyltransferase